METVHSGVDYSQATANAIKDILNYRSDNPEEMRRAHQLVLRAFRENRDTLPFPMYQIGQRLIEHAIEIALGEDEYRELFRQFADDPYTLAKVLIKKDPDRFFDFLLVAWNLRKSLPDYVMINEENPPTYEGGEGGDGEFGGNRGVYEGPKEPPTNIIRRIKENLRYLDEEDIFEMAIPLFKQPADKEKDGFQKGYEELLHLLDDIEDPGQIATIERVFDRFSELINMEFGSFKPHLKGRNFPYITVRRAIKNMERSRHSRDGGRRFAHFDTRTGKTSLALLEAEYLKKERSIYICPPDTVPTVVSEYNLYGGNPAEIYVVNTERDMQDFLENNGGIKYCIVRSSLIINRQSEENETDERADAEMMEEDAMIEATGMREGEASEGRHRVEDFRAYANDSLVQLFEAWQPDHVVVDEARQFTGYRSNVDTSDCSRALIYLLNNEESLNRRMTVRLMDATPGDMPHHFYSLLSIMNPSRFPMPEDVQEALGHQPYLLSTAFSERADQASHEQVYNRPPVRVVPEQQSQVEMGHAQSAIYDFASHYSTLNVLQRITLSRIATFNPSMLRPTFRRILGDEPWPQAEFLGHFDTLYDEWKRRSREEEVPFNWDFVARFGNRDLLMQLFSFDPSDFEAYLPRSGKKLETFRNLYQSEEIISCKAQYVIDRLRDIVAKNQAGERCPKRIIIYSTFKRGLTRALGNGNEEEDDIPLAMERFMHEKISQYVPEVNVYALDGNLSTKSDRNGNSPRDEMRQAWRNEEGINVLLAVGPATCQGVDLTVPGHMIEEIHMDTPMDSRLDYQVQSRTLGPRQNRSVTKQALQAVTAVDRHGTIDRGIGDLVAAKYLFRDLVCRGVSVPASFSEALENGRRNFLGEFCEPERNEEEVTRRIRGKIGTRLKSKASKKK